MAEKQENMWRVHENVRVTMLKSSDRQKRRYALHTHLNSFDVDLVWLETQGTCLLKCLKKCLSPRLQPRWEGPFNVMSDMIFELEYTKFRKTATKIVHHDRLKRHCGEEAGAVNSDRKT